jgi:hypothetical protein
MNTGDQLKCFESTRLLSFIAGTLLLALCSSCSIEPSESTSSAEPDSALEENPLEVVASQGEIDFALVPHEVAENAALLERLSRVYCDENRRRFCRVMIWTDEASMPRSLPMSDAQVVKQVAQYNRNRETDYDCFFLMSDGEMVDSSRSAGCS